MRNEWELQAIQAYIANNPAQWTVYEENPGRYGRVLYHVLRLVCSLGATRTWLDVRGPSRRAEATIVAPVLRLQSPS